MSSKKKSNRSDWSRCQSCNLLITNKDWSRHVGDCRRNRGDYADSAGNHGGSFLCGDTQYLDDGELGQRQYGCIENGVLYAVVCLPAEKGSEKLMPSSRLDLIHLNPDTMQLCGLHIGRPIFLSSPMKGEVFVSTAWPVSNFPAASAGIPIVLQETNQLSGGDIIRVQPVQCPIIAATRIKVLCNDDLHNSSFKTHLFSCLKDKHVLPGNTLHINYYGRPCHLKVWSVTGIDDQEFACSQSDAISESGDQVVNQSEYKSRTSDFDARTSEPTDSPVKDKLQNCSLSDSKLGHDQDKSVNNFEDDISVPKITTSTPRKSDTKVSGTIEKGIDHLSTSLRSLAISSPNKQFRTSQPQMIFKVTSATDIVLISERELTGAAEKGGNDNGQRAVTYDMIGGLKRQLKIIRDTLEVPLTNPEIFNTLGVTPPRGALLYGPPGVGKTMIARAVAHEARAHVIVINGPEVMSKYYGESEAKLRNIFEEGCRRAPCLIFIDELDALCPKRDQVQSELEKRIVATLLTLMDGMGLKSTKGHVMVLGATNRPDAIDPALRRPGRFDREVEIGVPNSEDRKDILDKCLKSIQHSLKPSDVQCIAGAAHGYVGADLAAVCKEAAMHAFEQQRGSLLDSALVGKVQVTISDMRWALNEVKPSAMREVEIDVPKVYWSDIGGQEAIKLKLKQAVEWPIKHPEAFQRMAITPPRGILMYGPPGCSKTLIAKALATESGLNFIAVKGPELFNKWVGESERAVREVFRKARLAAPSIVFFDEIDALAVERGSSSSGTNVGDRVLGQLLTEIDGIEGLKDVTIVAATNRPDIIDKALMRPGRLDRILYISLPDASTRREILKIQFRRIPTHSDVDLEELVSRTDSYSGAEVVALCREAGLAAMQEDINTVHVCKRHFYKAFDIVKPRTTADQIRYYEQYQQNSGLHSI